MVLHPLPLPSVSQKVYMCVCAPLYAFTHVPVCVCTCKHSREPLCVAEGPGSSSTQERGFSFLLTLPFLPEPVRPGGAFISQANRQTAAQS